MANNWKIKTGNSLREVFMAVILQLPHQHKKTGIITPVKLRYQCFWVRVKNILFGDVFSDIFANVAMVTSVIFYIDFNFGFNSFMIGLTKLYF